MKKKNVSQEVKANVVTGMSSATGSMAGVVVGSMIPNEVRATEVEDEIDDPIAQPAAPTEEQVTSTVVEEPEDESHVNVISSVPGETPDIPENNTVEVQDARPNVLGYETVTAENGQQMDVAIIEAQGQSVAIVDADRDGIADVAVADLNGNGELDEEEAQDISEMGIEMQQFQQASDSGDQLTAQTAEIDYVNDANVDEYYA